MVLISWNGLSPPSDAIDCLSRNMLRMLVAGRNAMTSPQLRSLPLKDILSLSALGALPEGWICGPFSEFVYRALAPSSHDPSLIDSYLARIVAIVEKKPQSLKSIRTGFVHRVFALSDYTGWLPNDTPGSGGCLGFGLTESI